MIEISNIDIQLINDIAKKYIDSFPHGLDKPDLRALARELGDEVARRNYYKKNEFLSSRESILRGSEREIYESMRNGNKIYFSIDFHKCNCYELCDHNGRHLGEFRFDGIRNSPADDSGNHDILALK